MDALPASGCCPSGLSDGDKIARAHILFSKRKGPFDGFEIWDGVRVVFTYPHAAKKPEAWLVWPAMSLPSLVAG
jgi:hypothetical protein